MQYKIILASQNESFNQIEAHRELFILFLKKKNSTFYVSRKGYVKFTIHTNNKGPITLSRHVQLQRHDVNFFAISESRPEKRPMTLSRQLLGVLHVMPRKNTTSMISTTIMIKANDFLYIYLNNNTNNTQIWLHHQLAMKTMSELTYIFSNINSYGVSFLNVPISRIIKCS